MSEELVYKNPLRIDSADVSPGYAPNARAGSLLVVAQVGSLSEASQTLFDLASFDVELKLTRKVKPGLFRLAVGIEGEPKSGPDRIIIRHFSTREEMAKHTKGKMEWVRVQIQDIDE